MSTQTLTIQEFLEARLNEMQADAELAGGDRWLLDGASIHRERHATDEVVDWVYDDAHRHIARNHPAAVLADIAAKRELLALHAPRPSQPWREGSTPQCSHCADMCHSHSGLGCDEPDAPYPCPTVVILAEPYRDHPDWRADW